LRQLIQLQLRACTGIAGTDFFFDELIPLLAGGAFAQPFCRLMAAILAKKQCFYLFQRLAPRSAFIKYNMSFF
jgi:hypothetical protein